CLECIRRINKYVGPATTRCEFPIIIPSNCFECSCCCCSYRNNPAITLFCLCEHFRRFFCHMIKLSVHLMLVDRFCAYRPKCSQSDMKRNKRNVYSHCSNFIQSEERRVGKE